MAVVGTATVLIRAAEIPGQAARIVDGLGRTVTRGLTASGTDSGRGFISNFIRGLGRRGAISQMLQNAFADGMQRLANGFSYLSGIGFLAEQSRGIMDFLTNLDRILPKFAIMSTGLIGIVGWIGGLVGQIFTIVGDLQTVPALLAPVPGLIMGAVTAAVLLMVALQDAKEQLAPLKDEMVDLKETISTGFWDEARAPIIDMVESLFPALNKALDGSSRALGRWVGAFAEGIQNNFDAATIEEIFDAFDEGFDIMSEGGDAAAGVLRSFALIASDYFPSIARWLRDITIQFDGWLETIRNDGSLDAWIQDALKNLGHLWRGIVNFGGVLSGLTSAFNAAGFNGLEAFEEATARWNESINNPRTQNALTEVFTGFRAAFEGVNEAVVSIFQGILSQSDEVQSSFESIGSTISTWGDYLGRIFGNEGFASGVSRMFADFQTAFENIMPAITPLAEKMGDIAEFAGNLAVAFSGPFAAAIVALEVPFERVLAALTTIVETLAPQMTRIFESPEFATTVDAIADAVENFAGIVRDNMPGLEPIIDAILQIIATLASQLPLLVDVLDPLLRLAADLAPVFQLLADVVSVALIMATASVRGIVVILDAAYQFVKAGVDMIINLYSGFAEAAAAALRGDFVEAGNIMNRTMEDARRASEQAMGSWNEAMNETTVIAGDAALALIRTFGERMGMDTSMVESITSKFTGEEVATLNHIMQTQGDEAAMNYVNSILARTEDSVGPAADGMRERVRASIAETPGLLGTLGTESAASLAAALNAGTPGAGGAGAALREAARSEAATLAAGLTTIGNQSGDGLSQGLRDRINAVAAASGGLENASIEELVTLAAALTEEGRQGGSGLSQGLRDQIGTVGGSAQRLANAATDNMAGMYGKGSTIGSQLGDGVAAGIEGKIRAVAGKASAMVRAATAAAKAAAETASPSKLWRREIGAQMAAGAALGIEDGTPAIEHAAANAIPDVTLPISSSVAPSRLGAAGGATGAGGAGPTYVTLDLDITVEGDVKNPQEFAEALTDEVEKRLSTRMQMGVRRR